MLSNQKLLAFMWSMRLIMHQIISQRNMKTNNLFVGLVLSCIILLSYGQNCCIKNSIRVQGLGQYRIKPNIATIYASLSANGNTASDALQTISNQLDSILNALQSNGVSQNDIQTSSIGAYPRYNYTSDGQSYIIGYTVYVSLTVTIRGIDTNNQRIASVIDALATAGATSISGISYDTVDPNAGKATARVYAWNDAVLRAKQYAQLSGRKLGKVILIEEVSMNYYPYYYNTQSTGTGGGFPSGGMSSTSGLPTGYILVSVVVVVTWELI